MEPSVMKRASVCTPSIYSAFLNCDCGGTYQRQPHPQHGLLAPFCEDCGEIAAAFKVRKKYNKVDYEIRFTKSGQPLRTMEEAIAIGHEIHRECERRTFSPDSYRKNAAGTIAENLDSFINRVVLKHFPLKDEDPDYLYLRDFMAPYFSDVGVFAACEVHIHMFIRDMGLKKNPQREYARRLWAKILEIARPALSVA
jgi:hypothetical protein